MLINRALIGLAVVGMTGCIQSTTVINVKSDGSGTIEQVTAMSAQAIAQMGALSSMGGDKEKGGAKGLDMFSTAKMKSAAPAFGTGVTFVSSTPFKNATGEGVKAIYSFTDVTKLRIEQKPGGLDSAPGMTVDSKEKEELLFKFAKGANGNSVVTILFPEPKFDQAKNKAKEEAEDPNAAAGIEMMKQFMKGMRINIALRVDGRIVKTNSKYVDGSQVTLLDIDFDQLIANPAILKKLGEPKSIEEAKVMLRGVPGIKVNLEKAVTIEFAGR